MELMVEHLNILFESNATLVSIVFVIFILAILFCFVLTFYEYKREKEYRKKRESNKEIVDKVVRKVSMSDHC